LLRALLVTAERQVGNDESLAGRTPNNCIGVVDHVIKGYRQCRAVSLHGHAKRVADEKHIDAIVRNQAGKTGVVAGQDAKFFAFFGASE
jgi:hypothetical protein